MRPREGSRPWELGVEDAALSTCHLAGLVVVQRIRGPAATAAAVTGGTLGGAENRAGGVERGEGGDRALLSFATGGSVRDWGWQY